MNSSRKFQIAAFIILLFHTVGLIGMNAGAYISLFESVAWANILLSFALLMWCHQNTFQPQRGRGVENDSSQNRENAKKVFSQRSEDATDSPQNRENAKENLVQRREDADIHSSQKREGGKEKTNKFRLVYFIAITCIFGFCIEAIGIHTGWIFGTYHYTSAFGWSLLSVPLIIGVNWVLLAYALGVSASYFSFHPLLKVLIAAAFMTACDACLEGFAIKHHFWIWESGLPPLRNFAGWFLVSLVMQSLYQWFIPDTKNRLAFFYLVVFVIFLIIDRIL